MTQDEEVKKDVEYAGKQARKLMLDVQKLIDLNGDLKQEIRQLKADIKALQAELNRAGTP